ncbi:MAG: hypothetical protein Aurels2KO_30860 [Aureliella sp.]
MIVIYTDDQGTLDANCYGSTDLITPTFDRLAKEGVRFTQMYSPSAICSASRAGLMTGRLPVRAGVPANVSSTKGTAGMPTSELTLAELMKSQGYRTGHVGKWHLGYTPETMPLGQGFESSLGHMGGCIDNYSHFFYWYGPNRHDMWRDGKEIYLDGQYFGDVMVEECRRLITQWKDEPFFIYWAINWPHYPLQGTDKWREAYSELESPRREYAAFVSAMDERIGWVVNHLEELGLREDTLIVLQSDHGHSVEERTFFGGGNPGPYRGAKGCLFEAGIRVPAIVSWPAGMPQGEVRDQMVAGYDWFPTIAEITGAGEQAQCDGKSLTAVIADPKADSPHESLYWHLGNGKKVQWVVRKGPWKLLGNPKDSREPDSISKGQELFLANIETDPSETNDVSDEHPTVVEELQQIRQSYLDSLENKE